MYNNNVTSIYGVNKPSSPVSCTPYIWLTFNALGNPYVNYGTLSDIIKVTYGASIVTPTVPIPNKFTRCLQITGTNQSSTYINHGCTLPTPIPYTSNWTFTTWINYTADNNRPYLIYLYNGTMFYIRFMEFGNFQIIVGGWGAFFASVPSQTWFHFGFTISSDLSYKVYINGVLNTSGTIGQSITQSAWTQAYIGPVTTTTCIQLQDIFYFPATLSVSDIQTLYTRRNIGVVSLYGPCTASMGSVQFKKRISYNF